LTDLIEALRRELEGQDVDGLSTRQITYLYSSVIHAVLTNSGLGEVVREFPTKMKILPPTGAAPRTGIVDFAVVRDKRVVLALELDQADKKFSLTKLEHFAAGGARTIWIRWGRAPQILIPEGIELIVIKRDRIQQRELLTHVDLIISLHRPGLPINSRNPVFETQLTYEVRDCRSEIRGDRLTIVGADGNILLEFRAKDVSHILFADQSGTEVDVAHNAEWSEPPWVHQVKRKVPSQVVLRGSVPARAYQYWSLEEDESLQQGCRQGLTIAQLSSIHQRDTGGIHSRLLKLGLAISDPLSATNSLSTPPTQTEVNWPHNRLQFLSQQLDQAWLSRSWPDVCEFSLAALKLIHRHNLDGDVQHFATYYLGGLLDDGSALTTADSVHRNRIFGALTAFVAWVESTENMQARLQELAYLASEIVTLTQLSNSASQGQVASRLRRINRPDLAVQVCNQVLASSRLNYYALATRGAALADLRDLDAAISSLKNALAPFRPASGAERALNALARALRLRFQRDGDLIDAELSLVSATAALMLVPDIYASNTLLAAASIQLDPFAITKAENLIDKYTTKERTDDEAEVRLLIDDLVFRLTD